MVATSGNRHRDPPCSHVYAHGATTVCGRVVAELSVEVVSPADEGRVVEDCAGVTVPRGHGGGRAPRTEAHAHWAAARVNRPVAELTVRVAPPAH